GYQDEDGCPDRGMVVVQDNAMIVYQNVYFAGESSEIPSRAEPVLDAMAATLRGNPHIRRTEVRGHAAQDERAVWSLAASRAAAVRARPIELGVEPERLTVVPFGDTQPIDPRRNAQARERNR